MAAAAARPTSRLSTQLNPPRGRKGSRPRQRSWSIPPCREGLTSQGRSRPWGKGQWSPAGRSCPSPAPRPGPGPCCVHRRRRQGRPGDRIHQNLVGRGAWKACTEPKWMSRRLRRAYRRPSPPGCPGHWCEKPLPMIAIQADAGCQVEDHLGVAHELVEVRRPEEVAANGLQVQAPKGTGILADQDPDLVAVGGQHPDQAAPRCPVAPVMAICMVRRSSGGNGRPVSGSWRRQDTSWRRSLR